MRKESKEPNRLNKDLRIRIDNNLFEKIDTMAKAAGLTRSEIIRRKLEGLVIRDKSYVILVNQMRLLRGELARQGGLLKQLYNQKTVNPEITKLVWNKQIKTMKKIEDLIIRTEEVVSKDDSKNSRETKRLQSKT